MGDVIDFPGKNKPQRISTAEELAREYSLCAERMARHLEEEARKLCASIDPDIFVFDPQ